MFVKRQTHIPTLQVAEGRKAYDMVGETSSSSLSSLSQAMPIPFVRPRKTPTLSPSSLSPTRDLEDGYFSRVPTTPPSPKLGPSNGRRPRPRAGSAPASYRPSARMERPLRCIQHKSLPALGSHGQALGLAPIFAAEHGHHGDRLQELKDGDGDLQLFDAVAPEFLPDYARPHFRSRHSSNPIFPLSPSPSPVPSRSISPHMSTRRISHVNNSNSYPIDPPVYYSHHHAHSLGSHSPLTTCEPRTSRSRPETSQHRA